jgi:hypothetical protein
MIHARASCERRNRILSKKVSDDIIRDCEAVTNTNLLDPKYTKYDIPRFRSKVDIYLEIGPSESKNNQLLATVNLKSLGFTMNLRRHLGDIKCIYVLKA